MRVYFQEHPFSKNKFAKCAVVGNGGILLQRNCGQTIDSANFVMRCNLPPLKEEYYQHVGVKTDLVTANPSTFVEKYNSLKSPQQPLAIKLLSYGKALVLLSATQLSMLAAETMDELRSPIRAVFLNPEYQRDLFKLLRGKGLESFRPTPGLMMVSLALEVCSEVHLFGFWPFSTHPYRRHRLTNHYYDDVKVNAKVHKMSVEFEVLLYLPSN